MVVLDFFIVNVALPAIATDLKASESSLEWVVAGYGLAVAALLIVGGQLGDLFGRITQSDRSEDARRHGAARRSLRICSSSAAEISSRA
jgi:MFS family permease